MAKEVKKVGFADGRVEGALTMGSMRHGSVGPSNEGGERERKKFHLGSRTAISRQTLLSVLFLPPFCEMSLEKGSWARSETA